MLKAVEDRVHALMVEVKAIEKESEGVYLAMGRLFPSLMAETARSSAVAENSLSSLAGAGSSSRDLEAMGAFASGASTWFKSLHTRDVAFLDRINDSIERLSALDGLIMEVRADSEEMEIISLNAMTVALKSGSAGKAFSVITDELKRLSGQTILLTEAITARGQSLLDFFGRLRDSLGELDGYQDEFFGRLEASLSTSFSRLKTETVDAGEFFSGLIEEAKGIRAPVQRIMQEVQHQDIVRQSLEHVAISLEEAEGAARKGQLEGTSDEEELAFIASISDLAARLLEEIMARLEASAGSFQGDIDDVESRVARIEERRADYRAARGSDEAPAGPAGALAPGRTSARGDYAIAGFGEASTNYVILKKTVLSTARRLAEQVRVLDESFKGLAALLARFKNIVVASRIEIAKNRSLASVTRTVQGMVTLTGRLESDVSASMGTTKDFIKVAMAAIDEYAEGTDGMGGPDRRVASVSSPMVRRAAAMRSGGISATLELIEADIRSLDERRRATGDAIGRFELFTPEFLAYIAEARKELSRLQGLAARLGRARSELAGVGAMSAEALGGRVDREIHSDRLKSMIQRFTILTHKKAVGDLADLEVEEGVEVGEVTLF